MTEAVGLGGFILGFTIGWILIDWYKVRKKAKQRLELLGIYRPWRKR